MFDFGLEKYSLRIQYILFTVVGSLIVVLGLVWISYSTYGTFHKNYSQEISLKGEEIRDVFDEKVTFIEHFLQFIGSQITNSNKKEIKDIAMMIKHHNYDQTLDSGSIDDAITWNMVNFVTAEGYLVADSKYGMRKPIELLSKRDWIKCAKDDPWKLKFSDPSAGFITGDYIIPSGVGIYNDKRKKFYGLVSSSISIEKLTTSLVQLVDDNIVFALFNDSFTNILISDPFIDAKVLSSNIGQYKEVIKLKHDTYTAVELEEHVKIGDVVFSYYIHSSKYPFWFLIGFNNNYYSKELRSEILPKTLMNLLFWILFSSVFIYLSYQVVRPIIILGKAADHISKGRSIQLPNFKAKELNVLANQLNTISKIHYSLKSKQHKLHKMNMELSTANEFIKSNMSFLSHELMNPTSSIVEFSKMLSKRIQHKIDDNEASDYLSIINKASIHLNKQLNFFMELFRFQTEEKQIEEKPIVLKQLVDWNLSMIMHHAHSKRVSVKSEVSDDLKLMGDEIMVGQLIQNIAANGSKYNKVDGSLFVKAFVNKRDEIEIHFIDTGVGISKNDLGNIFKLFKRAKVMKKSKTVGYGIGLFYAQRCIEAHGGKITVSSKLTKGSIFKVIFPKSRTCRMERIKR